MDSPVEKFSESNVVIELILGNCLEKGLSVDEAHVPSPFVEVRGIDLLRHVGPRG